MCAHMQAHLRQMIHERLVQPDLLLRRHLCTSHHSSQRVQRLHEVHIQHALDVLAHVRLDAPPARARVFAAHVCTAA